MTQDSWRTAGDVKKSPLVEDQLKRIDDRMRACNKIGDDEEQQKYIDLKIIRDDLLKAQIAIANDHAKRNAANESLVAITQGAIMTGACYIAAGIPSL